MKQQETFAIRFFIRKGKSAKQGQSPIYVRVTVNGERVEMSLGQYVYDSLWHEKLQKCTGNSKESKAINKFLEATTFKLQIYSNIS